MKIYTYLLIALFFVFTSNVLGQETLLITYDQNGIYSPKKSLRKGTKYTIQADQSYNGMMALKSKITSFDLVSTTPDVLKYLSISSTASLQVNSAFRNPKNGVSEVINNLNDIIRRIDQYDIMYRQIETLFGANLKEWPKTPIPIDEVKNKVAEILNDEITKDDVLRIKFLMEENELWASYISELIKNDSGALSFIDVFSNFMAKRALLKENSAKYIKAILICDDIISADDEKDPTVLIGDDFTVKGDFTKIEYTILNKLTSDTVAIGSLNLPTYNQWTFDFSTGFYWNQLSNESYTLSSYSADSTQITFKDDYDKSGDIALGAQLNLTYMASGSFGLGINTGAAVSMYDGTTKYLMGGHIKLGSKKQFMLSGGISVGKVKRLSDAVLSEPLFSRSGNSIIVPSKFTEPKLVDKVESSIFFGLSYNLSGVLTKRK